MTLTESMFLRQIYWLRMEWHFIILSVLCSLPGRWRYFKPEMETNGYSAVGLLQREPGSQNHCEGLFDVKWLWICPRMYCCPSTAWLGLVFWGEVIMQTALVKQEKADSHQLMQHCYVSTSSFPISSPMSVFLLIGCSLSALTGIPTAPMTQSARHALHCDNLHLKMSPHLK